MMRTAHRASAAFSSSSYCSSRRLYVAQRIRGGLGGNSYSSSVAPPHLSCKRLVPYASQGESRRDQHASCSGARDTCGRASSRGSIMMLCQLTKSVGWMLKKGNPRSDHMCNLDGFGLAQLKR